MKALITGITGQDGSYLAELLLEKGYDVYGLVRRSSTENTGRIDHILKYLKLLCGDVTDTNYVGCLISELKPDEIYNLAAQSDVRASFDQPNITFLTNALSVLGIVETLRRVSLATKIYQASTSELYGGEKCPSTGYTETSPMYPKSPYATAKLHAYWTIRNYREAYKLYACNGILFNHESPRRGDAFVTKKITSWCSKLWRYYRKRYDKPENLRLGALDSKRDWGHAKDYVEAMYRIMQSDTPEDWVVATGQSRSVRDFLTHCLKFVDLQVAWEGEGLQEIGVVNGEPVIEISPIFFRPTEVGDLVGDSTKIRERLSWTPTYDFEGLVANMMSGEMIRSF